MKSLYEHMDGIYNRADEIVMAELVYTEDGRA